MARQFIPFCFGTGLDFRREDISEKAWQQIKESVAPFSFWKSKFQARAAGSSRTDAKGIGGRTFAQIGQ